ncbi:hypothetical protein SRABI84_04693 [Peribacillus simplex]|nr:hypothetical protein SRABI84_04693 [Peribacillus simplex]
MFKEIINTNEFNDKKTVTLLTGKKGGGSIIGFNGQR